MICKGCGKKVDTNKKFCTNCGWKIEVPVVKEEEFKKVIPKEPVKNKREKKEVSISNKSLYEKQESFFRKLSSNLKQKPVKSQVQKNEFKGKSNEVLANNDKKKKILENKEKKFNKPLLFFIGLASLGGLIGIAQYVSNENLYTYEDQNSDYQYYSFLDLDDRISRNPSDSEAFLQRSRAYYQAGNYTFNCRDLRKAMDLGNSEARELYYRDKFWWWDSDGKDSKYLTCESANLGKESSSISETSWSAEDVYSLVGGEQKYEELLEWASDNLSEVEIDDFNKLTDNDDFNSIKSAVLDLQKRRLNYFENIDKNSLID